MLLGNIPIIILFDGGETMMMLFYINKFIRPSLSDTRRTIVCLGIDLLIVMILRNKLFEFCFENLTPIRYYKALHDMK